jgi:hypothetical protein
MLKSTLMTASSREAAAGNQSLLRRAPANPPLQRPIDSLAQLGRALAAERLYRWTDLELRSWVLRSSNS